ncbi:ESPR-type extended signal peptide-containing protein [Megasphaera hexanoica]|uniref:ESPR-type extended signal peptide-containing protein n=1 Tax=Megasphaera hexanoica TaxID=1675036 RepID=A0ABW7DLB8_9FIRM|nr:ESPR-type extended signal peptide-containing protein [Megasphaera hexanoica]AXB83018.1 hypothetical protein ACT01_12690 [Megasphaera hexanoica]
MNKIFKVIWSKSRNCYVVASELAKGTSKSTSTGRMAKRAALAAVAALLISPLGAGYSYATIDSATINGTQVITGTQKDANNLAGTVMKATNNAKDIGNLKTAMQSVENELAQHQMLIDNLDTDKLTLSSDNTLQKETYDSATKTTTTTDVTGLKVAGPVSAKSASISGTLSAGGAVNAGSVNSRGNITAVGTIAGQTVTATGTIKGKDLIGTNSIISQGTIAATGNISSQATVGAKEIVSQTNITAKNKVVGMQGVVDNTLTSGNYVTAGNTVGENIVALDTQVKANADQFTTDKTSTALHVSKDGNLIVGTKENQTVKDLKIRGQLTSGSISTGDITSSGDVSVAGKVEAEAVYDDTTKTGNYVVQTNSVGANLSALDTQVKSNADAITTEATAREAGDTALNERITNVKEYLEKQTSDNYVSKADAAVQDGAVVKAANTIGENVTNLDAALAKETAARIGADAAQDKVIQQVNQNMVDGFNTINKNMADGFTALNQADANEAAAREAADTTLQTNIDNEAAERKAADTVLDDKITAETSARVAADTKLVEAVNSGLSLSNDNVLQKNTTTIDAQGNVTTSKTDANEMILNKGKDNQITLNENGIKVGTNSTVVDKDGVYTGGDTYSEAKAAMSADGKIKGANGAFTVDENGNVTSKATITGETVTDGKGASMSNGTVTGKTLTDGIATITNGNINTSGSITGGTVTSTGNISALGDIHAGGAITGASASIQGALTAGSATITGDLTAGGAIQGKSISDGTATMQNGNLTGVKNLSAETITTSGDATIGGDLTVKGKLNVDEIDLTKNGIVGDNNVTASTKVAAGEITGYKKATSTKDGSEKEAAFDYDENGTSTWAKSTDADGNWNKSTLTVEGNDVTSKVIDSEKNSNLSTQTSTQSQSTLKDKDSNTNTATQSATESSSVLQDKEGKTSTFQQRVDEILNQINSSDTVFSKVDQKVDNISSEVTDGTNTTSSTQTTTDITNTAKQGTITNEAKDIINNATENMTNTVGKDLTTTVTGKVTEDYKSDLDTKVGGNETHYVAGNQTNTVSGDRTVSVKGTETENFNAQVTNVKTDLSTTVGGNQTTTVTGDSSLTAENITNEAKNKITNKAIDVETDATSSIVQKVTNDAGSNTSTQLSYQTKEEMSQADGKTASYLRGAAEEKSQLIDGDKKTTIDTIAGQTNTNITDGTNTSNDLQKADQIASSVTDGTNTTVVNQDAKSLASSITDGTKSNNTNNTVDKSEQLIKASDTQYSATSKTATKMEDALVSGSSIIDVIKNLDDAANPFISSAVTDGTNSTGITQTAKDITNTAKNGTIANDARDIINNATENMTNTVGKDLTTTVGGEMKTAVTGKVTEDYKSDLDTKVGGNETHYVAGNQTNTVGGTLTETVTGKATENYNGGLETTITGEEKHTVNGNQINNITGDQTNTITGKQSTTVTGDVTEDYKANLSTTVGGNQTTTVTGDSSLTAENITNEAKNKITNKAIDVETDATSSIVQKVTNDAGSNTSTQLSYQTTEEMSQADGKTASYLRGAAEEKSQLIDGSNKTTIDTIAGQTNTNITDGTNTSNDLQKADQIASSVTDGTNTTVVNQDAKSLASSITDGTKSNNTNNTVDKSEQLIKASDSQYNASVKTATTSTEKLVSGSIIDILKDADNRFVNTTVSTSDGTSSTSVSQGSADITNTAKQGTITNDAKNLVNKAEEKLSNSAAEIENTATTSIKDTVGKSTVTTTTDGTTFENTDHNTAIGDGSITKTTISGNTLETGKATMDYAEVMKDLTVGGTTTTKDLHVTNNATIDGTLDVTGAANFQDTVTVAKDLSVGGNASVSGSMTASSYKVGDKTYIDDNGINANNQKITNVAAGELSANSLDAVNGSQLYETNRRVSKMDSRINEVGANAAAMANLHPLEFDADSKFNVAAAVGNYKNETATALGLFYRPNEDVMVNLSGTVGSDDNMIGGGVAVRIGRGGNKARNKQMAESAKYVKNLESQVNTLQHQMDALLSVLNPNLSKEFPDVPENHWAYEAVSRLAGNGIIQGYEDGKYHGERTMTRYEMAEIIYKALQKGAKAEAKLVEEFKPELKAMAAQNKA